MGRTPSPANMGHLLAKCKRTLIEKYSNVFLLFCFIFQPLQKLPVFLLRLPLLLCIALPFSLPHSLQCFSLSLPRFSVFFKFCQIICFYMSLSNILVFPSNTFLSLPLPSLLSRLFFLPFLPPTSYHFRYQVINQPSN